MELPSKSFEQAIRESGVSKNAIILRNQKWFKELYIDRTEEPPEPYTRKRMEVGKAYSFTYDAKYKDKLDFWDVMPHLCIQLGVVPSAGGKGYNSLAINFSYIPPQIRMAVLDKIVETFNRVIDSNRRRIEKYQTNSLSEVPLYYKIAKQILKGSGFEFAIRSYIYNRIQTQPRVITYDDWWRVATFPTRFVKKMTIRQIYYLYKRNVRDSYRIGQKEKATIIKGATQKEINKLIEERRGRKG